jgi:hypothetical protein
MKTKIIIFLTMLISIILFAQDDIITWSTVLNDGVWEARAYSALETTDGNYILAGCLFDQDPYSPDWQLKHSWIVKLNAVGDTLWTKRYFTNFYVNGDAADVVETPENEFIISGNENGGYLLKMDADGNQLYYKRYEYCTGFGKTIKTSGGNYLTTTNNPAGLFKFDNNCDSIWSSTISKELTWRIAGIAEATDGYLAVGSYFDDNYSNPEITPQGVIVKYDKNGNELWRKLYEYDPYTHFTDTKVDYYGDIVVTGYVTSGYSFISKYNSEGEEFWCKKYFHESSYNPLTRIKNTSDGNFVLTGTNSVANKGVFHLLIMKTDQNGDSLWTKRHTTYYGGPLEYPADSEGHDIIQTADGGYLAVGETFPDLWALKVDENGDLTGISEDFNTVSDFRLFQNYPNPFNSETVITYSLKKPSEVAIIVFNTKGEFVKNLIEGKQEKGNHTARFIADDLNSGIYYYQLKIDGIISDTKRMVYLK